MTFHLFSTASELQTARAPAVLWLRFYVPAYHYLGCCPGNYGYYGPRYYVTIRIGGIVIGGIDTDNRATPAARPAERMRTVSPGRADLGEPLLC